MSNTTLTHKLINRRDYNCESQ